MWWVLPWQPPLPPQTSGAASPGPGRLSTRCLLLGFSSSLCLPGADAADANRRTDGKIAIPGYPKKFSKHIYLRIKLGTWYNYGLFCIHDVRLKISCQTTITGINTVTLVKQTCTWFSTSSCEQSECVCFYMKDGTGKAQSEVRPVWDGSVASQVMDHIHWKIIMRR